MNCMKMNGSEGEERECAGGAGRGDGDEDEVAENIRI